MKNVRKRVRRMTLAQTVANSLRGKNSMSDAILALHRTVMSHQAEALTDLTSAVTRDSFRIPDVDFGKALDISSSNLGQIEKLSRFSNANVELNYLKLAVAYILQNPDRVNAWIALDERASAESLIGNPEVIKELLLNLSPVDQQSLQSIRLYAALHSFSDDLIREYLDRYLPSQWTKSSLLFPLIYYIVHLPDNHALDQMIGHYFPNKGTGPAQRILVKFLLQPDDPTSANLAMRCYVALVSHPYDALEYITTDLERRIADGDHIDADYLDQFLKLAEAFPQHRVAQLSKIASGVAIPFLERPNRVFEFDPEVCTPALEPILSVLDVRCETPPSSDFKSPLMSALYGARWSRYPDPMHFDELATFHRRFSMLASGRLIRHIATSLYLFPRENAQIERLAIVLGACCAGAWTPFNVSGPQGYLMLRAGRVKSEVSNERIFDLTNAHLGPDAESRSDRVWIKAANWLLMEDQISGRLRAWAAAAHSKFPVHVQPRYLSGLDWNWLKSTMDVLGMGSLLGNGDMVYVLFLRLLEEFRRESVPLRLAFKSIAIANRSGDDLGEWLVTNFGNSMSAFVRFFLSADTILKLKLADNYMAAVSLRLDLLVQAVETFGYVQGYLNAEDLEQEQDVLTAMLCRMSVGARQFEIDWDRLAVDAGLRNHDAYSAWETLAPTYADEIVGASRRTQPYQFANGAIGEYESLTRDWPLVLVIGGVIDTFLTHPSTGIESILSVRIRHDAFRREYEFAIHQVEGGSVAGVSASNTRKIVKRMAPAIYREIQQWIDPHMHTWRRDKPKAFFNFIPTRSEMSELLQQSIGRELREIVQMVIDWLRPRLDDQLAMARESLANELGATLEKRVQISRLEIDTEKREDSDTKRVADALTGALRRRTTDLDEWFKVPEGQRVESLTADEVMNAVRQRFRMAIETKKLIWNDLAARVGCRIVKPPHIRLLYDLLSEVLHNASKHSGFPCSKLRLSSLPKSDGSILVISNKKMDSSENVYSVEGHPSEILNTSLLGERKSGLQKIAHMAASIAETKTKICVIERHRYFHLIISMDVMGLRGGVVR